MRKLMLLILMFGVIGLWGFGCDNEVPEPPQAMADVVVTSSSSGCESSTICKHDLNIEWTDFGAGVSYFQILLKEQESIAYISEVIENSGPDENGKRQTTLTILHTSVLPAGDYKCEVYKLPSSDAYYKQRLIAATSSDITSLGEFSDDCDINCCNDGYFYAGVKKPISEPLNGISGRITTIAPFLCRYRVGGTETAHSNVYVGLLDRAACEVGDSLYAETGFIWSRFVSGEEPPAIYRGWYATVRTSSSILNYGFGEELPCPDTTEPHNYQIDFYPGDGGFVFKIDDAEVENLYPEPVFQDWEGAVPDLAVWTAEIRGHETDMAVLPTPGEACWFSHCEYHIGASGWHDLDLTDSVGIMSTDDEQWQVEPTVQDAGFTVRDLYPMPRP